MRFRPNIQKNCGNIGLFEMPFYIKVNKCFRRPRNSKMLIIVLKMKILEWKVEVCAYYYIKVVIEF